MDAAALLADARAFWVGVKIVPAQGMATLAASLGTALFGSGLESALCRKIWNWARNTP